MTASASVAANFACVLTLLRDQPDAREEQVAAFRLFLASLNGGPMDLRTTPRGLRINGTDVLVGAPGVAVLRDQLLLHGVGEIRTPGSVNTATLLEIMRALAAQRGRFASVYELSNAVHAPAAGVVIAPPAPEDAEEAGDWSMYEPVATDAADAPAAPAEPEPLKPTGPAARLSALLQQIERDPASPAVPDLLGEVVGLSDFAADRQQWSEVIRAGETIVAAEQRAGTAAFGRAYSIALRRMLPRSVLEHFARMVGGPLRPRVLPVLQRMGADSTEVLLGLLASASTIEERRAYYGALRQMTEGTELLVNMLTHDDWFVIRNVADLCGELAIEAAVPRLAKHLAHPDERVRRSVAGALSKIGTASTIEPLRQALRDPSPTVRLQAVQGVDRRKGRGLAMTLAVLLEDESHPDVVREMLVALGRIGTAEAVQALVRAATPGRRLFSRKPVAIRLAAVEGLRAAGTTRAAASLQSLLNDDDGEVRQAAQKALAALNG